MKRRVCTDGAVQLHVTPAGEDQAYLTGCVTRDASPIEASQQLYGLIAGELAAHGMLVAHERLFGALEVRQDVLAGRRRALEGRGLLPAPPPTCIEGRPVAGHGLAGAHIYAVRPDAGELEPVHDGQAPCGCRWQRGGAGFIVLQGLHGLDEGGEPPSRAAQARGVFERAGRILAAQGADYGHVVRTWIYIADILGWYGEFNDVRNAQYRRFGLVARGAAAASAEQMGLPASTGIQGRNPLGAALMMDLLAVVGQGGHGPQVAYMDNVKQGDPFAYGSAFSRGACVRERDVAHVHVSGTAAIDEGGSSLFPGDVRAQIGRTLDTVEALLAQKGGTLRDICQATAFLKRAEDAPVYQEVIAERGVDSLPAVVMVGDVCRAELLFEMDATAVLVPASAAG